MVSSVFRAAVRDEHHGPAGHLARRRGDRGALACDLFAHSLEDSFSDGEFVPLGSNPGQLLGQLFFEFVQFRTTGGDPFQKFGIQHAAMVKSRRITRGTNPKDAAGPVGGLVSPQVVEGLLGVLIR